MAFRSRSITSLPGVQPNTDFTEQSTPHAVFSDKVRYVDGFPEKIGGWKSFMLDGNFSINGCPRNIFSYTFNNELNYLVGTHTNLYYVTGAQLTNLTPVQTSTSALNNDFSTVYGTLANNPATTILGSNVITIADAEAQRFLLGDLVTLSGSSAVNGIPAIEINGVHAITNVTASSYDVTVSTNATSSGTGGGAAVVRATRLIQVTFTLTDYLQGDNVAITNAVSTVGGIPAASINGTQVTRNIQASTFDFETDTTAASSVTNVGGTADIAVEIPDGECNAVINQGYGLNLYGVGLYGVPKTALNPTLPRVWSFDRYGDLVIFTPGGQTGLYSWDTNVSNLPTLVANAPTQINYAFTSNEIAVTLGDSGVGNRIKWSDQGVLTSWIPAVTNQAGEDDIEGAGDFISHASLRGFNLLFTRNKVYTFRYIGRPLVWETKELDPARGLIARNARIVVNGIAYWMGEDNFYLYRGGNVEIIPSNSTSQTTLKDYVFNDINTAQRDKIFAWYNQRFNEIWWHYPDASSNEPNRIARYNVRDNTWVPDTLDRSAGEYPTIIGDFPFLINVTGTLYQHENGADDDTVSMPFVWRNKFNNSGTKTINLQGVIPDNLTNNDISLTVNTKRYPQSSPFVNGPYTISPTTEKISYRRSTRYWQYEITGNALGQTWRAGDWMEIFNPNTRL